MSLHRKLGTRGLTAGLLAVAALVIGAAFGAAGTGNAASGAAPTNATPPTISGTATVGSLAHGVVRLVERHDADHLLVPVAPVRHERRQLLEHQRGESLDVHAEERRRGHTIRVRVTAKNADGSAQVDVGTDRGRRSGGTAARRDDGCPTGTGPARRRGDLPAGTAPHRRPAGVAGDRLAVDLRPRASLPRLGVWRPLGPGRARLRDGRPVRAVQRPGRSRRPAPTAGRR